MEFIKSNLWEIKKSSAVTIFGAAVALGHILIFVNWALQGALPLRLAADAAPMCWPLLNRCDFWLGFPEGLLKFVYYSYVVFAGAAFLIFLFTRLSSVAWFFLSLCFLCFLTLYFRDYRLSSNEHFFWLLMSFVFLFIPNKENNLRFLAISYWVAWGIIRLRPEWLTGLWIMDHFPMPIKLAEWLGAMSVLIMMIAPFGLLFRDGRYVAGATLILLGLNILIWLISDFFAPAIHLCALLFFVLLWFEKRKMERDYIYQSFIRPEPSRLWVILILGLFWVGQLSPYVSNKHPWLKPYEAAMALTPLAAIDECKAVAFAKFERELRQIDMEDLFSARAEDLRCHPQVNFMDFRRLCAEFTKESSLTSGKFQNLHVSFYSRGFKDVRFNKLFESDNICEPGLTYMNVVGDDGL